MKINSKIMKASINGRHVTRHCSKDYKLTNQPNTTSRLKYRQLYYSQLTDKELTQHPYTSIFKHIKAHAYVWSTCVLCVNTYTYNTNTYQCNCMLCVCIHMCGKCTNRSGWGKKHTHGPNLKPGILKMFQSVHLITTSF